MYDVYSKFDIEQHKKHFTNYLEVIILPDGTVEYAVPSHQEKLIAICQKQLRVSRDQLMYMCPEEYYADFMVWLCNVSHCVAVWNNFIYKSDSEPLTNAQYQTLDKLKKAKLYKGEF